MGVLGAAGAAVAASVLAYPAARAGAGREEPQPQAAPVLGDPEPARRPLFLGSEEGAAGVRAERAREGRSRAWPRRARGGSQPGRARRPSVAAASRSARARARLRPRALRDGRDQ